jgi:hypothetical protein
VEGPEESVLRFRKIERIPVKHRRARTITFFVLDHSGVQIAPLFFAGNAEIEVVFRSLAIMGQTLKNLVEGAKLASFVAGTDVLGVRDARGFVDGTPANICPPRRRQTA